MGTKLTVQANYSNDALGLRYRAGETVEVADVLAGWLLRDAPGCFAPFVEPPSKAVDAPAKDKMLRKPKVKK